MQRFQSLLGTSTLLKGDQEIPLTEALENKSYVALYFAADWCDQSTKFTPMLIKFYNNHHVDKDFEIIFVSSDTKEEEYNKCFSSMPWLAIPFQRQNESTRLKRKFKIQTTPALILFDKNAKLIATDGRLRVMTDPTASKFPWIPPTLIDILSAGPLVNKEGDEFEWDDLYDKEAVGVYFSAHWCGPCRAFTPKLEKVYNKLEGAFEVIFVSSDSTLTEFEEYFESMPWLAVPYDDEDRRADLLDLVDARVIPHLIIIDPKSGKIITTDGRLAVESDSDAKDFPWKPPALQLPLTGSRLSTSPCFAILFNSEDIDNALLEGIKSMAEEYTALFDEDGPDHPLYFYYDTGSAVESSFRQNFKLGDQSPLMLIFSVPDQAKYIWDGEVTVENARKFIQDYLDGNLEPTPFVKD